MRHVRVVAVAALTVLLLAPAAARADWSGSLAPGPGANFAAASGSAPWATWISGGQLHAGRLTDAGWTAVGGPLGSSPATADIALDGDLPWVAWRTTANDVNVARLGADGSWQQVGTALQRDPATAFLPSVTIAVVAGRPWIAWREADGDGALRTRTSRLAADGVTWEPVDPLDWRPGGVNELSLTAIGGRAWLAWTQSDGGPMQVHVASAPPDGDWSEIGGSANADPNCIAQQPSIAGVDGRPWVAWSEHDCSGSWQVRVARLKAGGDAWEQPIGGTAPINGRDAVRGRRTADADRRRPDAGHHLRRPRLRARRRRRPADPRPGRRPDDAPLPARAASAAPRGRPHACSSRSRAGGSPAAPARRCRSSSRPRPPRRCGSTSAARASAASAAWRPSTDSAAPAAAPRGCASDARPAATSSPSPPAPAARGRWTAPS